MDSLIEQANSFGLMVVAGLLVGLLFDLYRVFRGRVFSKGTIATLLGDFIYCLLAAALIYGFMIFGSWGEIRFYLLVGVLCGVLFYFLVFSQTTLHFLVWGIRAFGRGCQVVGSGAKNAVYSSLNFGVSLSRKTGVDKVVRKGRVKVGALQEKVSQLTPKIRFRVSGRPKRRPAEVSEKRKRPGVGKRFNRAARILSARSRNFFRGLGRGFKVKR